MRNTIIIFLLSLSSTLLFTTCKNPGIDYNTFSITEENIQPGAHNVMVSGEYDFLGEVTNMKLNIGLDEQLTDAESHSMNLDNQSFSITVDNLKPSKSYYYCYVVEFDNNHKLLTDVDVFKTLSEKPVVRILDARVVDSTKISVKCIVDDDFGMDISERGICWNHTGNPSLNDNHVAQTHPVNGLGEYTCDITSNPLNPPYYIRAYAKNSMGISYSDEVLPIEKPTVETLPTETGAITQTSATCKGRIEDEGSSPVTERGIYWGITPEPDNWTYSPSGPNGDEFLVTLSELTPGTTYYYCAYATNNVGTGYGTILNFNTNKGDNPVVRIDEIEETYTGTAVCKCFAEDEGSSPISERGVCWSTGHNPTITNSHTTDGGNGLGSYSVEITDFTQGESYFVRAYAKNSEGHIGYSTEVLFEMKKIFTVSVSAEPAVGGRVSGEGSYFSGDQCTVTAEPNTGYRFQYWANDNMIILDSTYTFTVTSVVSLVAHFTDSPVGTIGGSFTIDYNGNKVWFSQGNLQYKASTPTWRFAPHQYDIIGDGNRNISNTYNGWIDLFGWATSGYHNPNDIDNVNYHPWSDSPESSGYGPSSTSGELTGNLANYDWGVNNPISNGGDQPNLWRTLSKDEWNYIIKERNASTVNGIPNARFVNARVNDVLGVVLFPDEYTHPAGVSQPTGINDEEITNGNNYSTTEFALMQAAGAVFLPAAGKRYERTVSELDIIHYWSVSYNNKTTAYELKYELNSLKLNPRVRCDGLSVRLVCPVR